VPLVVNCRFFGNSAPGKGGAVYNFASVPQLANCVFDGNSAGGNGGAVFNGGSAGFGLSGESILLNCTLTANSAVSGGGIFCATFGDGGATLGNCIVWANSGSGGQIVNGTAVTFSCVQGGYSGRGNINVDPRFVDADGVNGVPGDADDDLRLRVDNPDPLLMPCIDTGENDLVPPDAADVDADGDHDERTPLDVFRLPRFTVNANITGPCDPVRVDMGAFENADCNMNELRDETELPGHDSNNDGILDTCQDCNGNGLDNEEIADCDLCSPACHDCNNNGRPDECDLLSGCDTDNNGNGVPDSCDLPVGFRLRQFFNPVGGALGRGMAFDGAHLYYTRWTLTTEDPKIYKATVTGEGVPTGTIVPVCPGSPPVPVGRQLGALSFDGTGPLPTLWAATYDDDPPVLYQIAIASGEVLRAIHTLPFNTSDPDQTAIDGLAFDPEDGSLFYSMDLGFQVFNVTAAEGAGCMGAPAVQHPNRGYYFAEGDMAGHAFDGTFLYVCQPLDPGGDNSNQPPPQILRTMTDSPTICLNFQSIGLGNVPFHGEGLAFDDVTFAPDCAIWVNGADETHYIAAFRVPCPCPGACPADLDGDGFVGILDFLGLLASWGPCPPPCPADFDGDGTVGILDFLALLAGWGACPPPPCNPG
jgi:polymorphic membrane protein